MSIIIKEGNRNGMYKGNCPTCGCEFLWGICEYENGGVRCPQCGQLVLYANPYYFNVPPYYQYPLYVSPSITPTTPIPPVKTTPYDSRTITGGDKK